MQRILTQINDRKDEDGFYPLDKLIFSKRFLYTIESDVKLYSSMLITTGFLGLISQVLNSYERKQEEQTKNEDEIVSALFKMKKNPIEIRISEFKKIKLILDQRRCQRCRPKNGNKHCFRKGLV